VPLHEHPSALLRGYLGDIGVVQSRANRMDFSGWFEAT